MSEFITIEVNPQAFKAEVWDLLKGSPLSAELANGIKLENWYSFGLMLELAKAVVASVEIVKTNAVTKLDPTGEKRLRFDSALALETAIGLLDELVVFGGWGGGYLEKYDRAILLGLVNLVLTGLTGKNWLGTAEAVLGIKW